MSYKVHPGIGVARVGNSSLTRVGPVTAAEPETFVGSYKDNDCRIQRLGARFEVWKYDEDGVALTRVDPEQAQIIWQVQAATTGGVAAPPLTITGINQVLSQTVAPFLELQTDSLGRLLVYTRQLADHTEMANDGTGDGTVQASVVTNQSEAALPSWVVLAPPDFAPVMRPIRSVCDQVAQLLGFSDGQKTSFRRHVFPVLRAADDLAGIQAQPRILTSSVVAQLPNLNGQADRQAIKNVLSGQLTTQQDQRLNDWVNGTFVDDWAQLGWAIPEVPIELDQGPLDHCLQQGTGWDVGPSVTTVAGNYLEPFRLDPSKVAIGTLRLGLASNWELDLEECGMVWPAQATTLITSQFPQANDWVTRGFVQRDESGQLYMDNDCGVGSVPLPRPQFNITYQVAGVVILFIYGGGAGDGVVVVLTPHGPGIIGPGDPLHVAAGQVMATFARGIASIAERLVERGAAGQEQ